MQNNDVTNYITNRRAQGAADKVIRTELLNAGWTEEGLAPYIPTNTPTISGDTTSMQQVSTAKPVTAAATSIDDQSKGRLKRGWGMLVESLKFLLRYPAFLVPLFFAWAGVAGITLYLRYVFEAPDDGLLTLMIIFGAIFTIAFIVSLANIMMLELFQQIENGRPISFGAAFREALVLDVIKVIPVALLWSVLWFILLIIRVLTSKARKNSKHAEASTHDAARTLGGVNGGPLSWWKLGLSMFEKLVRMYIFMALPAIAWENQGPFKALGKAGSIIRSHPVEFLTTYTLTGIMSMIMALPLIIIFTFDDAGVEFSSTFWSLVIFYEGIVWTLGIYLEQMSVALLYWWHLVWQEQGGQGELSGVPKPKLMDL